MVDSTYTQCMLTMQTWSRDIFQSDDPIWKPSISSWPLEPQDHFMICNEQINACNAIMIFGYMDGHSSNSPWLNHGCKIECLQPAMNTFLMLWHLWRPINCFAWRPVPHVLRCDENPMVEVFHRDLSGNFPAHSLFLYKAYEESRSSIF